MKSSYIHLLLTVVLSFTYSFSQTIENPWVKIQDHNGNTGNINIDCDYNYYSEKKIRLTAQYSTLKNTNKYEVSAIDYPLDINFSKGTPIDITQGPESKQDDIFSDVIKLPFKFCFYGNDYQNIVISDNGVVSFDVSQAKKDCSYRIAGTVPSSGLPRNAIYGVYHDMYIGAAKDKNGKIRISEEGIAPYRKFTISYDNVPQFAPINEIIYSSSQIVLYETFNVIDVYVGEKKLNPNTRKEKRAVIGIMNATGSDGISPPGRNTGEWEAKEEAWRFTPNGETSISVRWINSNNAIIGRNNTIDVSPSTNTTYKVQVTTNNGCKNFTIEDIITVNFSDDFPSANNINVGPFCVNQGENYTVDLKSYENQINPDQTLTFTYYKNSNLTIPIYDEEVSDYAFSSDHMVYVKVLKSGICYSVGSINLKLNKRPVLVSGKEYKVCDVGNDNKEQVNLYSFAHGIPANTNYEFLDSDQVEISRASASNYLVDVTLSPNNTKTFYLKAWNSIIGDKDCYTLVPFTVKLVKKIELNPAIVYICSVKEGQLVIENLTKYREKLLSSSSVNPSLETITWEFFANSNYTQKITNPESYTLRLNKIIYVKASHPDFCEDTRTELRFMAGSDCDDQDDPDPVPGGLTPLICNAKDPQIIDLGVGGYLPLFFENTSVSYRSVEVLGFYGNVECTRPLPLTGDSPKYLYSIFPPSDVIIYLKYKLPSGTIGVNSLYILVSKYEELDVKIFDICDTFNDGEESVDLQKYREILSGLYVYDKPKPSFGDDEHDDVIFFDNKEDRDIYLTNDTHYDGIIKGNSIILKSTDNPKTLYPVVRFSKCRYPYDIQFNLVPIEEKEIGPYVVCDFDNDGIEVIDIVDIINKNKKEGSELNDVELLLSEEQREDLANSIKDLYKINYFTTLQEAHIGNEESAVDPKEFELNHNSSLMAAYIRLVFKNQCPIIVKINFKFTTAVNLPQYKNLEICDLDRNKKQKVDLSEIIEEINGATITFFTSQDDANNNTIGGAAFIGKYRDSNSPIFYDVDASVSNPVIIYMRVDDGETTCFKVLPIEIKLIEMPYVSNTDLAICDFENDGKELITSSNIKKYVIDPLIKNNSELNDTMTFEFYLSENDAINNENQLTSFKVTQKSEIWVNISYKNCSKAYKLRFSLTESPKLNSDITVKICNNNTKNNDESVVNEVVSLNSYNSKFLMSSQTIEDFTFKYFKEKNDAINDISQISGSSTIIRTLPSVFWVRVEDKNGCFSVQSINIEAYPELNVKNITDEICNDETRVYVNLNELPARMIESEYNLSDFDISFHTTKSNAVNNIFISSPEDYEVSDGSEVWVKFVYKFNCESTRCCFIIRKINFSVPLIPKEVGGFIDVCDESDGVLDNTYIISNLDDYKTTVVRQPLKYINENYVFTYYRKYEDAVNASSENAEDPKDFIIKEEDLEIPLLDTDPLFYRIYIRIDRKDGKCSAVSFLSVNVTSKIWVDNSKEIEILACEKEYLNGIAKNIDLTATEGQITSSEDAIFTYYQNEEDARNAKNPIEKPSAYTTKEVTKEGIFSFDVVFVRIGDSKGIHCDNLAQIKIKVYPFIKVDDQTIDICEYEVDGVKSYLDLWAIQNQMVASIGEVDKDKLEVIYKQIRIIFINDSEVEIGRVEDAQGEISESITQYTPPAGKLKELIKVRFEYKDLTCFYDGLITIEQKNTPRPEVLVYMTCDEDLNGKYDDVLLKDLDLLIVSDITKYNITYYSNKENALKGISSLDKTEYFEIDLDNVYYFRVEDTNTSCIGINMLNFVTHPVLSLKDTEIEACDSDLDGFTSFDLTLLNDQYKVLPKVAIKYYRSEEDAKNAFKDAAIGLDTSISESELSNYINVIKNEDYVYVRVEDLDNTYCPSVAKIKLKTYEPVVPEQTIYMCPDTETILDGESFDQYIWEFKGKIIGDSRYVNVNQFGVYKLTVTKLLNYELSCTIIFNIEVKELEKPVIQDLNQGKDYITVIAKGPAPLEYSMDNINWQSSNTFSNLEPGIYTFYVRSKANGCESLTSKGIIFGVYNVITPNGDGYNDVWRMCGLQLIKEPSHVKIFDRYGKQVFEEKSQTCFVWDGKYLGRTLPTASYWYIVTIADGRQYTGWIMLRNYNENSR